MLRYVNAAWLELADRADGSGLGQAFAERSPELAAAESPLLDRVYATRKPEKVVNARYVRGQSERSLTITAWPWGKPGVSADLIVIQVEETTGQTHERDRVDQMLKELRRVNERLLIASVREQERSTDRAEQLAGVKEESRAKSTIISSVSHELRTPLNALLGFVDLMADELAGPVSEQQRDMLRRMKVAGLHLLQLVEQILTYSRTEAGQLSVKSEQVDVSALVRETVALIEPFLSKNGVSFKLSIPDASIMMETDPGLLRQILINLLTNAAKFTDAGEIHLEVSQDGKDLTSRVQDTGFGIAPENLERIFEPFQRVDDPRVQKEQGAGLGLAVSRRLARLLGGDLTVESEPGVGSTFTLRCPLQEQKTLH